MRMRHIILSIVVINFLIAGWALLFLPIEVESATITEFGNPGTPDDRIIELNGSSPPYVDSTTCFEVPTSRGRIKTASLKISPVHQNDEYSTNPYVDVGLDGEIDWEFKGTGYGVFGYQTRFSNGATSQFVSIPATLYHSDFSIRLPKTCNAFNTTITITYTGGQAASGVTLNVGINELPYEWQFSGLFQGNEMVTDFYGAINNFISANENWEEDDYGNQYVDVPLNFSASAPGGFQISGLNVRYQCSATIDKTPNSQNLATRLNDMIPINTSGKSKAKAKIYVAVYTNTKCKFRLSELEIEYNSAPEALEIPDTYTILEDSYDENLINLTEYYTDDYQDSIFLNYEVISYTNPEYVAVDIYDKFFLGVNAGQEPNSNWFGETEIVITAIDSEGIRTHSNEFIVTITEINDPPEIGYQIPNMNLTANETNMDIDLDAEVLIQNIQGYYFTDVDSTKLYFKAIVAHYASDDLSAKIHSGNILNLTAIGEYRLNIPVRIFCDDDKSSVSNLDDFYAEGIYQEFFVNITSLGGYTPPIWSELPDTTIPEDTVKRDWLNLRDYVTDFDDILENLTFSIATVTNSAYMTIVIGAGGTVDILPAANFDGISKVTLRVQDDEYNFDTTSFTITMKPQNDIPTIEILSPGEREYVSGQTVIRGAAYDIEDTLERVELQIGDESNDWVIAEGTKYWTYSWDTLAYAPETPKLVKISVRAYDGQNYSDLEIRELIVSNIDIDADDDGHPNTEDLFPNDPSEWADTDGDGYGNNRDLFPFNESEWADSDGDTVGDNIDAFPFSAADWLDTDGDGYGDNTDAYPNDPTRYKVARAADDTEMDSEGSIVPYMWVIVAVIVIINVLIFIALIMARRQEKSKDKDTPNT